MRVLIVAATSMEVGPLTAALHSVGAVSPRLSTFSYGRHEVHVLITGVGLVATAVHGTAALAGGHYDVALNLGVCGVFGMDRPLGSVVHIVSDVVADLGVEDGPRFLSAADAGLLDADEFPYTNGRLVNAAPPDNVVLGRLPRAAGISVSTAHGDEPSVARVVARWRPDVESMEGAAFMYACLIHGVTFAQVRAVSNVVERRNRAAWKLPEAVAALGRTGLEILDAL